MFYNSFRCLDGWGVTDGIHTMGGPWDPTHELPHINTLDLFAAKLALEALAGHIENGHIHLKLDNQTAVTYINKKGGTHSKNCNDISLQVWHWAKLHGNWLSAAFMPGECNVLMCNISKKSTFVQKNPCHNFQKR